jgi:hypothetical protein
MKKINYYAIVVIYATVMTTIALSMDVGYSSMILASLATAGLLITVALMQRLK